MSKEFKLPDLGEGIHEAQVVNVMINEGDTVTEDQMVMEVETDKASVELPVPYAGQVTSLNVKQGDTVKVGQVLLVVAGEGGEAAKPAKAEKAESEEKQAAPKASSAPASAVASKTAGGSQAPVTPTAVAEAPAHHAGGPIPAAPSVRRLARENNVDLHDVHGTGSGGRILKEDVERFVLTGSSGRATAPAARKEQPSTPSGGQAATTGAPAPVAGGEALPDFSQWGPVRREAVPQIRKAISRQMVKSWSLPRVTHGDEADVTDLEAFRKEHGAVMAEHGAKLTITTFIVKAVAGALRQMPVFNASYDEAAGEIIYKDYVHIGMAVDTERGLMVPVLRDADRKGLMTISKEMREISDKAREFKLPIEGMRGGTFTVTNVGALGGTFSTPMINYPEVAILGMGKMQEKPVVKDGQIVVRKMMPLFLSFDHRVVDGADGARFTRLIIDFLENPLNLLLAS